ncbi:hypothetical protein BDK51DRAFT_49466 [Blyttiomyces helicus]|uniref:Uncharacterized protein n=1 Tax=Blyttiomyces helicus TaxID=388810 RepID=A0A4P9W1W2_9FUNG|nr:hypothetical protein BDK51DRAFT_49466 [Blyttiomyces helicus]|eukprot:RKO84066.1 hypothetical protein BDK51DRAFT_49466 [Blyttiomyces helicus]
MGASKLSSGHPSGPDLERPFRYQRVDRTSIRICASTISLHIQIREGGYNTRQAPSPFDGYCCWPLANTRIPVAPARRRPPFERAGRRSCVSLCGCFDRTKEGITGWRVAAAPAASPRLRFALASAFPIVLGCANSRAHPLQRSKARSCTLSSSPIWQKPVSLPGVAPLPPAPHALLSTPLFYLCVPLIVLSVDSFSRLMYANLGLSAQGRIEYLGRCNCFLTGVSFHFEGRAVLGLAVAAER